MGDQPTAELPGRLRQLLLVGAAAPVLLTALLWRGGVPLGCPGRFVYLYSPIPVMRLLRVPLAIAVAVLLAYGVYRVSVGRRGGLLLVLLGVLGLGLWTYFAPPAWASQHTFNAHSPAQDGAFVIEAARIEDLGAYLRDFPQRAAMPPAAMRGTRVVSNPPGATLLAWVLQATVVRAGWVGPLVPLELEHVPDAAATLLRRAGATGPTFFALLTALWLMAVAPLYWVGRLFLPAGPSLAYALACVCTPMAVLLTPGKDPAQLLSVALPLALFLHSARRGRAWAAALAGGTGVLACLVSLVHIWIAAVVAGAALWHVAADRAHCRVFLQRTVVPVLSAALATALMLHWLGGIDLPATVRAVAAAQAQVTRGPDAMPLRWQLLGLPLFLLFAGTAWWVLVLAALPAGGPRDDDARFGRRLLLLAAFVLLGTIGFTNLETPRLWIPFLPLLLLGAWLQVPPLRGSGAAAARVLALLVALQLTSAALQWALLDMREAETRLAAQRFYD